MMARCRNPADSKVQTHGTRKTRHQAPGSAQEVLEKDEGLFPHQEQALPVRTGSGQSRGPLCVPRPPHQEASVSPLMDSAHRRRRASQRLDVWPADSWPESRGRRARPQNPRGHCRQGRRREKILALGASLFEEACSLFSSLAEMAVLPSEAISHFASELMVKCNEATREQNGIASRPPRSHSPRGAHTSF